MPIAKAWARSDEMSDAVAVVGIQGPQGAPGVIACRLATAAALPANTASSTGLTANANGALTVDGVAVLVGDRILVKDEATQTRNRFCDVVATGSSTTPYHLAYAIGATYLPGTGAFIARGTDNARKTFILTTDNPIVVGTTNLVWQLPL